MSENIVVDTDEYLTKSALLQRNYWSNLLVKNLLGDPDKIEYRINGKVSRYKYQLSRIVDAENTDIFLKQKSSLDADNSEREIRKDEISESLRKAIEMDLKSLKISQNGSLSEVYNNCRAQLTQYNAIQRIVSTGETFGSQYRYEFEPACTLYELIAESRKDLRFECGVRYAESVYGIWRSSIEVNGQF